MSTFIAFLRTGADGHCRVEFPDLPGCTAEAPHVAQAAALAGDELIRYLTVLASLGEPAPPPTPEAVLAEVARQLPRHMVPGRIELVDALPLTPHGKVDYRALVAERSVGGAAGSP